MRNSLDAVCEQRNKRDEYLSLMEELEILGKKMRKTDKMLAVPNQPNLAKLERKREQYEREVTDIVLYAEQDGFFDLDGENGEAAMVAYMKANSLLGTPLETLAERPVRLLVAIETRNKLDNKPAR